MKALSIRQPWAWAIVHGYKPVENRSWRTHFRGEFYVHASKAFDKEGYGLIKKHQKKLGISLLPKPEEFERGGIVGQAVIIDCVSSHPSPWFFGEFGFVVENAKPLDFKPCKGKLNFFKPEIEMKTIDTSSNERYFDIKTEFERGTKEFFQDVKKQGFNYMYAWINSNEDWCFFAKTEPKAREGAAQLFAEEKKYSIEDARKYFDEHVNVYKVEEVIKERF